MGYLDHASREFKAAGFSVIEDCADDPEKWIQENVLELLNVLDKQGHSGSSIKTVLSMFNKLANFEPLVPLSGNDDEWFVWEDGHSQNIRCSKIFKSETGQAYTIEGYIFWHWCERPLEEDEEGFPGIKQYKSYFGSDRSRRLVTFPHMPEKPIYVEVECYETNKEGTIKMPGSGWWHTIYPQWIEEEYQIVKQAIYG